MPRPTLPLLSTNDVTSSDEEMQSISAPTYSPISEAEIASSTPSSKNSDDTLPDNDSDEVPDTSLPFPEQEQPHEVLHKSVWNGFKIVGDNIDKNVRPSFQRAQHQTKSLHYFNSYAVRD